MAEFKPNEEVKDVLKRPIITVTIVRKDPSDLRRWIVRRSDGFEYSASHFDLVNI